MKQTRKTKPLTLNKTTLRQLDNNQLGAARGAFGTAICTIRPGQSSIARTIY